MDSEAVFKEKYNIAPTYESYIIVASDETTALTTGSAKVTFRAPQTMTLTKVKASVTTAPSGAALTVDINDAGTSILSTKITIDAETSATGTVTIAGASGSIDSIEVNSVEIMSAAENFDTDLATTATAIAANITANTSTPNYTATAVDEVITITAVTEGTGSNGFTVVTTGTTMTATDVNMSGGTTEKTSETAATPPVISKSLILSDAELTIDIDQIGSTVAGAGLKVCLIGTLEL